MSGQPMESGEFRSAEWLRGFRFEPGKELPDGFEGINGGLFPCTPEDLQEHGSGRANANHDECEECEQPSAVHALVFTDEQDDGVVLCPGHWYIWDEQGWYLRDAGRKALGFIRKDEEEGQS